MILPHPNDVAHKAWLYRVVMGIADDAELAHALAFKGGTCAAMLGYLDRFSIDLDFDFLGDRSAVPHIRQRLEAVFAAIGLRVHNASRAVPQYFLKYDAPEEERNTLKLDVTVPPPAANRYEPKHLPAIDRILTCQTVETMVANKLVALTDRYARHGSIAGRDCYDIHHFFFRGFRYNEDVIRERTGKDLPTFFADLIAFIEQRVTATIIQQDLNVLLPYERFARIRKVLKQETLLFLRDELERVRHRPNIP